MPRMNRVTNRGGIREGSGRPATGTSERTVDRETDVLVAQMRNYTYEQVGKAFIKFTKEIRGHPFDNLLKTCIWQPASYNQVLREVDSTVEVLNKIGLVQPTPVEVIDAVTLLLHQRLSKQKYMQVASMINDATGVSLLPSYCQVAEYKKLCRPEAGITITEVTMTVELFHLLQHTLQRILQLLGEDVDGMISQSRRKTRQLTFLFSYGYDAATGQQMYKQRYSQRQNRNRSDSSLFAANINPLLLRENDGTRIWINPVPQSPWFVRPLILDFAKETEAYVTQVQANIQRQINGCPPLRFTTPRGIELNIRIHPTLSMIDGKVFNHLYNTIMQNCPICDCAPRDFNNEANIRSGAFDAYEDRLCHGCQPLHAWIRFASHVFNLSYNIPVHDAKARGHEAAELRAEKKRHVQRELLQDGLRIDFPAQNGSGSSMDGNTSRRVFKNYERVAEVTGVNVELLQRYWVILTCINNTRWKLKVTAFRKYCLDTYRCYLRSYSWYNLSQSIHKVLFHAADIQERLELPTGAYSEGAQETTHSDVKDIRIDSTRKNTRLNTNTDMLHRRLDNSDPIIASKIVKRCAKYRKTDEQALEDLPTEARGLLEVPQELLTRVRASLRGRRRATGTGIQPDHNLELDDNDFYEEAENIIPLDEEPIQNYDYPGGDEPMDQD